MVVNGIDCLDIRQDSADQKLKTDSSERLVPIHSRLKTLGFLEYVSRLHSDSHVRVFPRAEPPQVAWLQRRPSKWFTRVRARLGFEGKKDFHSFRHARADRLNQKGVSESLVGRILGHQTGGITFSRYGKGFRPEVLAPVIELVSTSPSPPPILLMCYRYVAEERLICMYSSSFMAKNRLRS
ncbi:tyrosine-type recombinase/integrase [Pseudomonas sp. zfem004]|uniref:tyrosine-type recombinase/integrase n=1 Tax=Pseudomonas sp. zfem004 TaxID=3078199 RepID=UPI0029282A03|nr:tyrosine-type recombinase/integrase [Pseudomonas sp. zfem004]MDU9401846.1 tyrosine-type recombinase/integrase [Pseudomonas sp. zfem004]